MHSERRHFVLLCGGAAQWENPSLPCAIVEVTVFVKSQTWTALRPTKVGCSGLAVTARTVSGRGVPANAVLTAGHKCQKT